MKRKGKGNSKISKELKQYVKKKLDGNIEDKWGYESFYYLTNDALAITSTPRFLLLSGLFRGTQRTQRVANKVRIKNIKIKGYLKSQLTHVATVRMSLIRVKGVNGVGPITEQIYADNTVGRMHYSEFNLNNVGEYFEVMWDKTFVLPILGGIENEQQPTLLNINKRTPNVKSSYNDGNTATVTDCIDNAYYLCVVTDQGTIANAPEVLLQTIVTFEDA